jgi:hypothetical protein
MFGRIKTIALAAALAAGAVSPALASPPRYEVRRLPNGPRPDHFVFVRIDDAPPRPRAPYALTGSAPVRATRHVVQRWAGPHYIGPVWTTEYVAE